jgi:hypothetical protein
MSDILTFVIGLIATILAVGPLAIAAALEMRSKDIEQEGASFFEHGF